MKPWSMAALLCASALGPAFGESLDSSVDSLQSGMTVLETDTYDKPRL
jgi:hypothetical protein